MSRRPSATRFLARWPSRFPGRSVPTFPSWSAPRLSDKFRERFASQSPCLSAGQWSGRCPSRCPNRSVARCLARIAGASLFRPPDRCRDKSPSRNAEVSLTWKLAASSWIKYSCFWGITREWLFKRNEISFQIFNWILKKYIFCRCCEERLPHCRDPGSQEAVPWRSPRAVPRCSSPAVPAGSGSAVQGRAQASAQAGLQQGSPSAVPHCPPGGLSGCAQAAVPAGSQASSPKVLPDHPQRGLSRGT